MVYRVLRRASLVVLGLLLALVAMEALLQAGALYVRLTGRQPPAAWLTGNRRIICVGDSHTYGLYLERQQSYPQQLQQQWDATAQLPRIEVLNLGVPGTNSSKLRVNFAHILQTFQPDAVLVMIGANDGWTVPVPIRPEQIFTQPRETAMQHLWRASRVFRLLYMVARAIENRQAGDLAVVFASPTEEHPMGMVYYHGTGIDLSFTHSADGVPDWTTYLSRNLQALIAEARAAGVQVVLLTYPSDYTLIGDANYVIRTVAEQGGVPLIDLAPVMAAACQPGACDGLYFPDFHATARGNEIVAGAVRERLANILAEQ